MTSSYGRTSVAASRSRSPAAIQPPKLLDHLRDHSRTRDYSIRTEAAYVDCARFFILFHGKRYPHCAGVVGDADVNTTMIYTHVLNKGGRGVLSPLDAL